MTEVFVEQPLASPGSAKYFISWVPKHLRKGDCHQRVWFCSSNLTGISNLNVFVVFPKKAVTLTILYKTMKLTVILRQYEEPRTLLLSSNPQYNGLGAALASGGVHPGSVQVARGQPGQLEPDGASEDIGRDLVNSRITLARSGMCSSVGLSAASHGTAGQGTNIYFSITLLCPN